MMRTNPITAANADERIKRLYETAFPQGEQIPWNDLMRLIREMPLDLLHITMETSDLPLSILLEPDDFM